MNSLNSLLLSSLKKWNTYTHHQLGKANKILFLFHDPSLVSFLWIYPFCKLAFYFSFSCKVDPVKRPFSRMPSKYQIESLTIFHRLIFISLGLWFSFGLKFQRWFKVAKICATQVCKTDKRERIMKMSHTHRLFNLRWKERSREGWACKQGTGFWIPRVSLRTQLSHW